jgi:hypothetical protein
VWWKRELAVASLVPPGEPDKTSLSCLFSAAHREFMLFICSWAGMTGRPVHSIIVQPTERERERERERQRQRQRERERENERMRGGNRQVVEGRQAGRQAGRQVPHGTTCQPAESIHA